MPHNGHNFTADQEEECIISPEAFQRLSDAAKAKYLASRSHRTPRGNVSDEVHTHTHTQTHPPTHTQLGVAECRVHGIERSVHSIESFERVYF
jgi:hypothetical protein